MTELLERRRQIQAEFDKGAKPDFLAETAHVRFGAGVEVSARVLGAQSWPEPRSG